MGGDELTHELCDSAWDILPKYVKLINATHQWHVSYCIYVEWVIVCVWVWVWVSHNLCLKSTMTQFTNGYLRQLAKKLYTFPSAGFVHIDGLVQGCSNSSALL